MKRCLACCWIPIVAVLLIVRPAEFVGLTALAEERSEINADQVPRGHR